MATIAKDLSCIKINVVLSSPNLVNNDIYHGKVKYSLPCFPKWPPPWPHKKPIKLYGFSVKLSVSLKNDNSSFHYTEGFAQYLLFSSFGPIFVVNCYISDLVNSIDYIFHIVYRIKRLKLKFINKVSGCTLICQMWSNWICPNWDVYLTCCPYAMPMR